MRIRWTSVPKVVGGNPVAPWVGPSAAERLKDEGRNDSRDEGQEKSDRSRRYWARITKKEEFSK
jgi:hypothetical protein